MSAETSAQMSVAGLPGTPRRNRATLLLALPAVLLLLLFLAIPYFNIVVMSFREPSTTGVYGDGFTLQNYGKALLDPYYLGLLFNTFKLSVITVLLCLVIGYPMAVHLARTKSRFRGLLFAFVLSPLLTGVVIRCFGWIVLLANAGPVNRLLVDLGLPRLRFLYTEMGVIIACVHVFLPFMILPIMNAIQSIDPRFEEAARTLGASRWRTWQRVLFPLSMPGLQSGVVLVFVLTASAYVIPALLGGGRVQTMPTIIVQQLMGNLLWPSGAALAITLALGIVLACVGISLAMKKLGRGVL